MASEPIAVSIHSSLRERFPGAALDFLVCKVPISCPKKGPIYKFLSKLKQDTVQKLVEEGVSAENLEELEEVKVWRRTFAKMGVAKDESALFSESVKGLPDLQSSLVNLLQRAAVQADLLREDPAKKADLGKISNFVDLYNCVSLQTKCPMGAYALSAIAGGKIELRVGSGNKEQPEMFLPLLSAKEREAVEAAAEDSVERADPVFKGFPVGPDHVVYSDAQGALTWLWNYRDGARCCVPAKSAEPVAIILMADTSEETAAGREAVNLAAKLLPEIGGEVLGVYHLDASSTADAVILAM